MRGETREDCGLSDMLLMRTDRVVAVACDLSGADDDEDTCLPSMTLAEGKKAKGTRRRTARRKMMMVFVWKSQNVQTTEPASDPVPAKRHFFSSSTIELNLFQISLNNEMLDIGSANHIPLTLFELYAAQLGLDYTTILHNVDEDV